MEIDRLLGMLKLKINGLETRQRDLEAEVLRLQTALKYNVEALSKADTKLMELNKD